MQYSSPYITQRKLIVRCPAKAVCRGTWSMLICVTLHKIAFPGFASQQCCLEGDYGSQSPGSSKDQEQNRNMKQPGDGESSWEHGTVRESHCGLILASSPTHAKARKPNAPATCRHTCDAADAQSALFLLVAVVFCHALLTGGGAVWPTGMGGPANQAQKGPHQL